MKGQGKGYNAGAPPPAVAALEKKLSQLGGNFCEACNRTLPADAALQPDGQRLCQRCVDCLCVACGKTVLGVMTRVNGQVYHPPCFRCKGCGDKLMGNFNIIHNENFCKVCAVEKGAPPSKAHVPHRNGDAGKTKSAVSGEARHAADCEGKHDTSGEKRTEEKLCVACNKPLGFAKFTVYHGQNYHKLCFTCSECDDPIQGIFTPFNDERKVCQRCMSSLCDTCGHVVQGHATRADGKCYHPKCFLCASCGKELKGNFHVVGGQNICPTCVQAKGHSGPIQTKCTNAPRARSPDGEMEPPPKTCCVKCGGELVKEWTTYENEHYHKRCFACEGCRKPITGAFVTGGDGGKVCRNCMDLMCEVCDRVVKGAMTKVDGKVYHPDCFNCDGCGSNLAGNFHSANGENFCKVCYDEQMSMRRVPSKKMRNRLASHATSHTLNDPDEERDVSIKKRSTSEDRRCVHCKQPLGNEKFTIYDGHSYHKACFVCNECQEPIAGTFRVKPGNVKVCNKCCTSLCQACGKLIEGSIMEVQGQPYHPECFVCKDCNVKLEHFILVNEDYLCTGCSKERSRNASRR